MFFQIVAATCGTKVVLAALTKEQEMAEKWFISDTHFFHENIIRFSGRPFANAELMNECMVEYWNSVVKDGDYVYHLGDLFIGGTEKERASLVHSLKGRKRLIIGNHDYTIFKQPHVISAFEKIMYWHGFKEENFTATHIPHELKRLRDGEFNVHGHTHNWIEEDPHYINVCVEHHNYTPVHMDEIKRQIALVK